MPFPTSRQNDDVDRIAEEIDTTLSAMLDQLQAWRARINTNNGSSGSDAFANYQRITSTRAYVAAKVATNAAGIIAAYQRRYAGQENFDVAAAWATSKAAIDAFVTWFKGAWPKDAAGRPVFHAYGPDDQIVEMTVSLTGGAKTTVLANIDAVLNTFA